MEELAGAVEPHHGTVLRIVQRPLRKQAVPRISAPRKGNPGVLHGCSELLPLRRVAGKLVDVGDIEVPEDVARAAARRAKDYEGAKVVAAETERDEVRKRRLAEHRRRYFESPVLIVPLTNVLLPPQSVAFAHAPAPQTVPSTVTELPVPTVMPRVWLTRMVLVSTTVVGSPEKLVIA